LSGVALDGRVGRRPGANAVRVQRGYGWVVVGGAAPAARPLAPLLNPPDRPLCRIQQTKNSAVRHAGPLGIDINKKPNLLKI